jgi:hypothetical protein
MLGLRSSTYPHENPKVRMIRTVPKHTLITAELKISEMYYIGKGIKTGKAESQFKLLKPLVDSLILAVFYF